MPLQFDLLDSGAFEDGSALGISDREIVELLAAFRPLGFFRIELDTGLFYATSEIYHIFGMELVDGPMDMREFRAHLHPDDLPTLMAAFERAAVHHEMYHKIYRVRRADKSYKYVRSVGKFRHKPDCSGEIVGVTYEFFERFRTVAFQEEQPVA